MWLYKIEAEVRTIAPPWLIRKEKSILCFHWPKFHHSCPIWRLAVQTEKSRAIFSCKIEFQNFLKEPCSRQETCKVLAFTRTVQFIARKPGKLKVRPRVFDTWPAWSFGKNEQFYAN